MTDEDGKTKKFISLQKPFTKKSKMSQKQMQEIRHTSKKANLKRSYIKDLKNLNDIKTQLGCL